MDENSIIDLRLDRQHLTKKIDTHKDYEALFKLMQPVAPIFYSEPGDPPSLVHRTTFDDKMHNDNLRNKRVIVKGRFQDGNVGYVYLDELELYIAAYKKEIDQLTDMETLIYELLLREGPLTIHQIKEETKMLAKEITPILLKLSKAFMVYEDQVDSSWERGWYVFNNELDNIDINRYKQKDAVIELVKRALYLLVFVNLKELQGWLRLPLKIIQEALDELLQYRHILLAKIKGVEGYMLYQDYRILQIQKPTSKKSVFVLHKSDILVKAFEQKLKETFKDHEILQYILIDGKFQGAVCGHWRIGPHDITDIVLTIPEEERESRKEEILDAVKLIYQAPFNRILKYDGKEL